MKYEIGHRLKQKAAGREHIYTLTSVYKHVNQRGFDADVLVWTGSCAACGCSFETTGSRNGRRHLTRTCTTHQRTVAPETIRWPSRYPLLPTWSNRWISGSAHAVSQFPSCIRGFPQRR